MCVSKSDVSLLTYVECSDCSGSGIEPGNYFAECWNCDGTGEVVGCHECGEASSIEQETETFEYYLAGAYHQVTLTFEKCPECLARVLLPPND